MNAEWKSFLETCGASIDESGTARFADAKESSCALFDLSHLGLIKATGEEAEKFLQGQLSNDTTDLAKERSQLSAYCSPKGRMIASMRLFQHDGATLLLLPIERLAPTLQRLKMFILMSKVELNEVSDELVTIGLYGDCAAAMLGDAAPAQADDTKTAADGVTVIRLAADTPRFMLTGTVDAIKARWTRFNEKASPSSLEHWQLLDIRAGLPTIYDQTAESFVPQMTNMQLINGVSFTKGCYTGQEVVARMQYLGKLKRRMYRISLDGDCPTPGSNLASEESTSGQGAGKIVMSAPSGNDSCEALAVIEVASAESGEVHLDDDSGRAVTILDLPYSLSEND